MSEGAGGWLWLVVDVGLVAALKIVWRAAPCSIEKTRAARPAAPELRGSTGLIENASMTC